MKAMRVAIAVAAAGILVALAMLAGFGAPRAFGQAASPSSGAAQAVYCPKERKHKEKKERDDFDRGREADRKAYFSKHSSASLRAAFDRQQREDRDKFMKKHHHCDD